MSMRNIWKEVRFTCKPTAKQIRQAVKSFKRYCKKLNDEFDAYCDADESGELDG
jgi:enamine deaminase RidA (YjgF/YER057c/UK114 family)